MTVKSIGMRSGHEFVTKNISAGGVFIAARTGDSYPFDVGSMVDIELNLTKFDCRVISFLGKIAHDNHGGFGIKIIQIDEAQQNILAEFVKEHRDKSENA